MPEKLRLRAQATYLYGAGLCHPPPRTPSPRCASYQSSQQQQQQHPSHGKSRTPVQSHTLAISMLSMSLVILILWNGTHTSLRSLLLLAVPPSRTRGCWSELRDRAKPIDETLESSKQESHCTVYNAIFKPCIVSLFAGYNLRWVHLISLNLNE